ncbi:MAG TPA: periplasmic heavy metal sensor [Bacteroidia bacterium]|jgi:Spy/CpxP family protein refolding chaperone
MSRTRLLTLAIVVLVLLNLGTLGTIFYQGMIHHKLPPPGEGPKMIIIERLQFDEVQQKQYEVLIDDHRKQTRELHEDSRKLHKELYSLLSEEPADHSKKDSFILRIAGNQKALDNLNFDHFQQIRELCKPEQIPAFNDLAEDLAELFGPKGPPEKKH